MFRTGLASSGGKRSSWQQALRKWQAAAVVASCLAAGWAGVPQAHARTSEPAAPLAEVALVNLPSQAQSTYRLVLTGGPFKYDKDGIVFGNRERLLPPKARGHYREYTVPTPGAKNRGARRIVCGGQPPTQPEACFYTDDHYASFRRIVP